MLARIILLGIGTALVATSIAAAEVERSVIYLVGREAGFQTVRRDGPRQLTVHYEFSDRGRGPVIEAEMALAERGLVEAISVRGLSYFKTAVDEQFSIDAEDGSASWKNNSEDERREQGVGKFYLSLEDVPEFGTQLARALLQSADQSLELLPAGTARISLIGSERVPTTRGTRKAQLYAISGLSLSPSYLWLDENRRFVAGLSDWFSVVAEAWQPGMEALHKAQQKAEQKVIGSRSAALLHKLEKPMLIHNVRVFDVNTLRLTAAQSVLIDKGLIQAVGADGSVEIPANAEQVDGKNRVLLPGLWDMHVHLTGANDGLMQLASGVTTVRDLANDPELLGQRMAAFEDGSDVGPRVLRAGFIDGRGPYAGPTKVYADDVDEAQAAVDGYADSGHVQIKVYSSLKPELVAPIAKAAHARGMRLSGHVPQGMSAADFVRAGADEIQHANFLMLNFLADQSVDTRTPQRFSVVADRAAEIDLSGAPMAEFIALLKEHGTVVDPTLGTFEDLFLGQPGIIGPTFYRIVDRMPPGWQRFMRAGGGGLPREKGQIGQHRDSFQRMVELVGMLHRAGVPIVAGTDNVAGLALVRELELYVAAGIAPAEVLRLATLGSAQVMGLADQRGAIAVGQQADLILVDGDPTQFIGDLRRVRMVVRGDRWVDPDQAWTALGVAPAP